MAEVKVTWEDLGFIAFSLWLRLNYHPETERWVFERWPSFCIVKRSSLGGFDNPMERKSGESS